MGEVARETGLDQNVSHQHKDELELQRFLRRKL